MSKFVVFLLLLSVTGRHVGAQEVGGVLEITRLTEAVNLDGVVDEAAWDAVAPLPLTM
ncbi:MAG: hypothetical protein SH809_21075 [Rhodothermales bacterium]|nr:hypothetical protein [Rhodothermales bacterium]